MTDGRLSILRPRAGELILEGDGRYGWGVERQFWYERARRSAGGDVEDQADDDGDEGTAGVPARA